MFVAIKIKSSMDNSNSLMFNGVKKSRVLLIALHFSLENQ